MPVTAYTPTTTQPITNYIPVLETAASGVARFDHSPTTGESLGFLVEEQRANLLTYSEQFDNAAWVKSSVTIQPNIIVSPDATLTGDKLLVDSGVGTTTAFTYEATSKAASAIVYKQTVFAKIGEFNQLQILVRDAATSANSATVRFSLIDGSIVSAAAVTGTFANPSATVGQPVGNGWYRFGLTFTSGTETSIRSLFYARDSVATTGNGYSGIYIWGAQLEAGAFPTSYIKTEASQVTRSADAASMTGANFSSWYNAGQGTLFAEVNSSYLPPANEVGIFRINTNTASNEVRLRFVNALLAGQIQSSAGETLNQSVAASANVNYKSALAYATDNSAFSVNGSTATTDTSVALPSAASQAIIGASATGVAAFLNGTIKRLSYYPKRLANTQLQALTTP
jgi:hypothetical protein